MSSSPHVLLVAHTLGKPEVRRDGELVTELATRPQLLSLICYLAVEREAPRERLANLLWGEREPGKARHGLSQALYTLRKLLGEYWVEADARYVRVNEFLWSDLADFESAVEAGDWSAALDCASGSFLEGWSTEYREVDHWASRRRALVDRALRQMFRAGTDSVVSQGKLDEAVALARAWVERDPLDDEANHKLIEILALTGERSESLRHFELYRRQLAADDLIPLEHTRDLVAEIRRSGRIHPAPRNGEAEHAGPERRCDDRRRSVHVSSQNSHARADAKTKIWAGGVASAGPRLVRIVDDGQEGEVYLLSNRKTVLGRTTGELRFPEDPHLDPVHATVLTRSSDPASRSDHFILRDESAKDGIFLRIRSGRPLRPGDVVSVGQQRFKVAIQD